MEALKLTPTVENYLSLIYVLERDDEPVVGAHLAKLIGVTPPTVTNTLKRISRDGLITMDESGTHLTETGLRAARTVMRRHMLTEWMMVRMLPWSKLHLEAHSLEHAISAEAEAALLEQLGHPQTCPHGNPLPGSEAAVAGWVRLTQIPPGAKVTIRRVHELAEENPQVMAFLEEKRIMPGVQATVVEILEFNETTTLRVEQHAVTLGFAVARYIFVEQQK
jgi:DtxR family transcriptional regulator, Mn-dependent transcriptional regulator